MEGLGVSILLHNLCFVCKRFTSCFTGNNSCALCTARRCDSWQERLRSAVEDPAKLVALLKRADAELFLNSASSEARTRPFPPPRRHAVTAHAVRNAVRG